MAKRKKLERAADTPDSGVLDASDGLIDSRNYYHLHPIWKTIQEKHNLDSSISKVPRGQRSKGRVRSANIITIQDDESPVKSVGENVRSPEESDSGVICEYFPHYVIQSRRRHRRTTEVVQKLGKLDSKKFEFYMEYKSKTKGPCMLLLDSLQKGNCKQLEPRIRRFVFDIFMAEERQEKIELISKIPLLIPKVPQQKNGEECGPFVLYYINLFLESAADYSSFSMGYPHFMKEDWFTPEEVECFIERLDSMSKSSYML